MKKIVFALSLAIGFTGTAGAQTLGNGTMSTSSRVEGAGATGVAPQATTSPPRIIYRIAGLVDSAGGSPDLATVVNCTNFSTVSENVRIIVYQFNGNVVKDFTAMFSPRSTYAFSTHPTVAYFDDFNLATGTLNQGSAFILATTNNVMCTASVVNATATDVQGVDLRMQRLNPVPGSTE